jgi:hypothetical protein
MDWACDRMEATIKSYIHTYIPFILMGKYLENTQLEDRKGDGRIILS